MRGRGLGRGHLQSLPPRRAPSANTVYLVINSRRLYSVRGGLTSVCQQGLQRIQVAQARGRGLGRVRFVAADMGRPPGANTVYPVVNSRGPYGARQTRLQELLRIGGEQLRATASADGNFHGLLHFEAIRLAERPPPRLSARGGNACRGFELPSCVDQRPLSCHRTEYGENDASRSTLGSHTTKRDCERGATVRLRDLQRHRAVSARILSN